MTNIQDHIKYLLYRNDCVIVEGFGAFLCQRQPARIQGGFIFPPRRVLSFNSGLKTDDGLLANHISKHEKVSYQIAKRHIKSFSQNLINSLKQDKNISIKDVGSFVYSPENKIIFQPEKGHDWLLGAYGLPNVKLGTLDNIQEDSQSILTHKESDSKQKPHKTYFWRYAAVGIIAIGVAGIIGSSLYKENVKAHNFAEQVKAKEIVNQKIQESSFVISQPISALSVDVNLKNPQGKYHIIAGAFRIKANATKRIGQLQDQGFDAKYLGENRFGLHQISYESHSDRIEALKALRKIKREISPSAWLFVKEF